MTRARDLASTALNSTVNTTELGYLDGVTSSVQTQLDNKLATATAATTYVANALADAKGDIVTATADNTPARLAVGNNGETLVADSSTSTGLRYTENYAAGKNKIINGDFYINQRNFTSVTSTGNFFFDRFLTSSGNTGGTAVVYTLTPQTFTPGTAPVAGYEGKTFTQVAITTSTSGYILFGQKIEDVRTFANQQITVSFWAKAAAGTPSVSVLASQQFGSGGSGGVDTYATKQAITTSWARYSFTMNIPSISGKTIGTNSHLHMYIVLSDAVLSSGVGDQTGTFSIWGVQAEDGPVATAFQTATGTLQGELAACQRYYYRTGTNDSAAYGILTGTGWADDSTSTIAILPLPVTMRVAPTAVDFPTISTLRTYGYGGAQALTALTLGSHTSANFAYLDGTNTSTITAGAVQYLQKNNSATAYIGVTAEL
jgi:hypothetical protein